MTNFTTKLSLNKIKLLFKKKKLPHNQIILWQRLSCTVLIALMLFLSVFGSFFRVPFNDDFTVFYETVNKEDIKEAQEEKYISFDFLGSTVSIFKMISLNNASYVEYQEAYYNVIENDHLSLSIRSSGIAYLVLSAFDSDITVAIYYVLLLIVAIGTPILLLTLLIIILTKYFKPKFRKTEHSIYKGTLNMFRIAISRIPLMLFLNILVPKTKLGFASFSIITLSFIGIIINASAAYFKDYTKAQKKYRTMLQLTSLGGIFVFIVFSVTLRASNLVSKAVALFDDRNLSDVVSIFEGGNFDINEILALLSGFIFFFSLFGITKPLANNFCRIGFTTTRLRKKDYSLGDSYIVSCIRPNVTILVFFLLIGSQSEFIFYKGELTNLVIAFISLVCVTLCEVAVHVLRETLCVDLGKGGMDTVLEGTTYNAQIEDNLAAEAKARLYEEMLEEEAKSKLDNKKSKNHKLDK